MNYKALYHSMPSRRSQRPCQVNITGAPEFPARNALDMSAPKKDKDLHKGSDQNTQKLVLNC